MADTPAEASKEATRKVFEDWFAAWSSHNVEKLVALCTRAARPELIGHGESRPPIAGKRS